MFKITLHLQSSSLSIPLSLLRALKFLNNLIVILICITSSLRPNLFPSVPINPIYFDKSCSEVGRMTINLYIGKGCLYGFHCPQSRTSVASRTAKLNLYFVGHDKIIRILNVVCYILIYFV